MTNGENETNEEINIIQTTKVRYQKYLDLTFPNSSSKKGARISSFGEPTSKHNRQSFGSNCCTDSRSAVTELYMRDCKTGLNYFFNMDGLPSSGILRVKTQGFGSQRMKYVALKNLDVREDWSDVNSSIHFDNYIQEQIISGFDRGNGHFYGYNFECFDIGQISEFMEEHKELSEIINSICNGRLRNVKTLGAKILRASHKQKGYLSENLSSL